MPTDGPVPTPRLLADAAAILARQDDVDAAIDRLLALGLAACGAAIAAVFAHDHDGPSSSLHLLTSAGSPGPAIEALVEAVGDPGHPVARAAESGEPTFGRPWTAPGDARMTAADLPLVVATDGVEMRTGAVSFGWTGGHETGADERVLLSGLADLIAVAIERARLASLVHERAEWFERVAQSDPLTGLSNGRTLARVLELEIARAARGDGEVSVAVFDVDEFAALNERVGRAAGDGLLQQVASVLAETVRLVDTVSRTGGDEFVVVAPGSAGAMVARRVMDAVGRIPAIAGTTASVSAGIARFPADGTTADELIGSARQALETARAGGPGGLATAVAATSPGD